MKYKPRKATEGKRRQILLAASEVFGEKGTSNATLEEIAERVGMTRAGLLHHFGSKRKLLLEVIRFRDMHDLEGLEGHHIPTDGEAYFRHLIETARVNESRPGIVRTFMVLAGESLVDGSPATEYFADRYGTLRDEITNALIDIAKERRLVIDTAKAEAASCAIIALMDGLQLQWLHAPDQVALADCTEYGIRTIVASVFGGSSERSSGVGSSAAL